jgi:hypothetical protein
MDRRRSFPSAYIIINYEEIGDRGSDTEEAGVTTYDDVVPGRLSIISYRGMFQQSSRSSSDRARLLHFLICCHHLNEPFLCSCTAGLQLRCAALWLRGISKGLMGVFSSLKKSEKYTVACFGFI